MHLETPGHRKSPKQDVFHATFAFSVFGPSWNHQFGQKESRWLKPAADGSASDTCLPCSLLFDRTNFRPPGLWTLINSQTKSIWARLNILETVPMCTATHLHPIPPWHWPYYSTSFPQTAASKCGCRMDLQSTKTYLLLKREGEFLEHSEYLVYS